MLVDTENLEQVKQIASKIHVNWFGLLQAIKQADAKFFESAEESKKNLDEFESQVLSDDELKEFYEKYLKAGRFEEYFNIKRKEEQQKRDEFNHLMSQEYREELQQEAISFYKTNCSKMYQASEDFKFESEQKKRYRINILEAKKQLQNALYSYFGKCYQWLSAYDGVSDWLTDNRGRGLVMFGNCGTGKTVMCKTILTFVRMQFTDYSSFRNKMYSAWKLNEKKDDILNDLKEEKLYLTIIDDVGVESPLNDYGNKSMVFSEIVDVADRYGELLVISTNLNLDELRQLYGDRTVDRLKGMCRFVAFEGESMRKVE